MPLEVVNIRNVHPRTPNSVFRTLYSELCIQNSVFRTLYSELDLRSSIFDLRSSIFAHRHISLQLRSAQLTAHSTIALVNHSTSPNIMNKLFFTKFITNGSILDNSIVFVFTSKNEETAVKKGESMIADDYRSQYKLDRVEFICLTPDTIECFEPC